MDEQNDKIQQALINIEALQKEYEITLQQYQEAVQNYISTLQNTSSNSTTQFTALSGRSWWGTSGLKEGQVADQAECENMCAASSTCTGATFNPVRKYCWSRTGDGTLTVGTDTDIALIPQQKSDLIVMKGLNDKLISLNERMASDWKDIEPEIKVQNANKNQKQDQLNSTYQTLLEEKQEIDKQLEEYYSIYQENEEQGLYANQENISYRFWILLTILVIIVTLRKMLGKSVTMSAIIWLFIIYALIIFTFTLSYPAGFAIWLLVLLAIILMKTGIMPSP